MCKNELDENLLTQGLNLFNEKMASCYPDSDELKDVAFSERFSERMKKLIVRERNGVIVFAPGFRRLLAVALVAAALFALSMSALASGENDDATFYIERRLFDDTVHVKRYVPAEPQTNLYLLLYPKKPDINYIPEGFECTYDFRGSIMYRNEKGEFIDLHISELDGEHGVDTEYATLQEVRLNGEYALYLEKTVRSIDYFERMLFWEGEGYYCSLHSNLSKEELFKIAESVAWEK